MAYQMAATAVILNDLKVIHRLQAFSNATRRTSVQHLTRFQLTMCSHRPSALAELLVDTNNRHLNICSYKKCRKQRIS